VTMRIEKGFNVVVFSVLFLLRFGSPNLNLVRVSVSITRLCFCSIFNNINNNGVMYVLR
jgi:hypothetical protein